MERACRPPRAAHPLRVHFDHLPLESLAGAPRRGPADKLNACSFTRLQRPSSVSTTSIFYVVNKTISNLPVYR